MSGSSFLPRGRSRWVAAAAAVALLAALWALAGRALVAGRGWATVNTGELVLSVPVTGTLKAVNSDQIGPPRVSNYWNFKIAFLTPEGAEVKTGQAVLRFDTSELERELEVKKAEAEQARQEAEKKRAELAIAAEDARLRLAEAEAALRRGELKLQIPAEIQAGNAVKMAVLDRDQAAKEVAYLKEKAEKDRQAAEAEITKLREIEQRAAARVLEIGDAIGRMNVTAPRSGTVIYVTNWRDEKRKVGDTVYRRDVVLEIPDLSLMVAIGQVDEADAGRVASGQRVILRLDAHPDVEFTGSVSGISQSMERKNRASQEKVARLEIALDATDRMRMRPGMRFVGRVEVRRIANAVLVPIEAVSTTPQGPMVIRRTAIGTSATRLRLGERNDEFIRVLSGLEPGDRVALQGRAGSAPR